MDNGNGNKLASNVPSALETTMVRGAALVAAGITPLPALPSASPSSAPPPVDPPGLAEAPSVGALMQALKRRWLLAFTLGLLGAGLTVAAVFFVMPPKFIVENRIMVQSKADPNVFSSVHREDTEFNVYKANLPSLMKAPLNLSSALNLEVAPGKRGRDLSIVRERGAGVIEWLGAALKTDYNLGPEILKVTLSAEKGDEAAELLNAVVQSFLSDLDDKEKARADDLVKQAETQKNILDNELKVLRSQLANTERAHNLPNIAELSAKLRIAETKLDAVNKDYTKNKLDLLQIREELTSLKERQKNIDAVPVGNEDLVTLARNDPALQPLFKEQAKAEEQLQEAIRVRPTPPAHTATSAIRRKKRSTIAPRNSGPNWKPMCAPSSLRN